MIQRRFMIAIATLIVAGTCSLARAGYVEDLVLSKVDPGRTKGLVFSYYAAATYVPLARAALREGRTARAVDAGSLTP